MSRNVDRAIGVMATLSAGIAVLVLRRWIAHTLKRLKQRKTLQKPQDADETFKQRYLQSETVWHSASCHCGRTRMRVKASRQLKAVDVPSKLRFPRVTVKPVDVDLLSEQHLLSTYSVRQGVDVGAHMFCSFCGMQIFVVPTSDPAYVLVNADCIERGTVSVLDVSFYSCPETVPCVDAFDNSDLFSSETVVPYLSSPVSLGRKQTEQTDNTDTVPSTPTTAASSSADLAPMLSVWAQLPKDELKGSFTSVSSSASASAAPKVDTPAPEATRRRSGVDTPMHNKLKQHLQVCGPYKH